MKTLMLATLLFIAPKIHAEGTLRPFETDGCTMFVDGTTSEPNLWRHCCVEHDLRYMFGGSEQDIDATDLRLKHCVNKVAGEKWADLIYNGVRFGHYSPIKNKYRWGWAWSIKREKKPLTAEEKTLVLALLKNTTVPEVNMDEFIKFYFTDSIINQIIP